MEKILARDHQEKIGGINQTTNITYTSSAHQNPLATDSNLNLGHGQKRELKAEDGSNGYDLGKEAIPKEYWKNQIYRKDQSMAKSAAEEDLETPQVSGQSGKLQVQVNGDQGWVSEY
ncbi:hypothetical protein BY996DRAFT_6445040 [Phakopsora pachyrhizi]|nr:hypothetical protein BY996DRAFT_6445040 [Phakopsora pachyrhizi]